MVATYDPKKHLIVFDGEIITGFADGTFIKANRNSEKYTPHNSVDGSVTRVKSNDKTGTVSITLTQNSPSNRKLLAAAKSGKIAPLSVTDLNFDDKVGLDGSEAWVSSEAEFQRGKEVGDNEWKFTVADFDQFFEATDSGTTGS